MDGKIRYVNPAFTALTGYTREEVVGENPRVLKSGRHPAAFYEELRSTIEFGRVWHGEVVNRRKDGSLYYEEMQMTPVQDETGEITSYIAIKRDVSERHAAEETRRFLAAIVENSEDSIVAYTPAGIILTWNHGAETIFGYTSADVVGKNVSMMIPPERHHNLKCFTDQVGVQGKSVSQFELAARLTSQVTISAGPRGYRKMRSLEGSRSRWSSRSRSRRSTKKEEIHHRDTESTESEL